MVMPRADVVVNTEAPLMGAGNLIQGISVNSTLVIQGAKLLHGNPANGEMGCRPKLRDIFIGQLVLSCRPCAPL